MFRFIDHFMYGVLLPHTSVLRKYAMRRPGSIVCGPLRGDLVGIMGAVSCDSTFLMLAESVQKAVELELALKFAVKRIVSTMRLVFEGWRRRFRRCTFEFRVFFFQVRHL